MALSAAQRAEIRRLLGYPDGNRSSNPALEGAMTSLSQEGQDQVAVILGRVATLEEMLASSWSRQKVIRAEEVTLAGDGEIRALRMEGGRFVGQLAALLGVEPRNNPFGGRSSSGQAARG